MYVSHNIYEELLDAHFDLVGWAGKSPFWYRGVQALTTYSLWSLATTWRIIGISKDFTMSVLENLRKV